MRFALLALAALLSAASAAQSVPAAISSDPPSDARHPASMAVVHIPSHGLLINGLVYQPAGAGPHPTLIICHGLPGNEKNLDLAQAVRRAGWNAVTFNYRGSWGSPGNFRFAQNLEDAGAVLEYLRAPANASRLGIDTKRIAMAGHSMGGWVTALTAAQDRGLIGAILISAADMGDMGQLPREKVAAEMADNMEALAGVTAESMADEVIANHEAFSLNNAVAGLAHLPLLVLTANDGLAPRADSLVKAIQSKGGKQVTTIHAETDHGWSDHRIYLETVVIDWIAQLK
jgi:acetyl esterase/lipase